MVLRRSVELVATSRADHLALRALAEIVEITTDQNVRIVGGQMVALLLAAFPVSGVAPRRTRDADTAITTELAGSGACTIGRRRARRRIVRRWLHGNGDGAAGCTGACQHLATADGGPGVVPVRLLRACHGTAAPS
jgi:hypothetical protein